VVLLDTAFRRHLATALELSAVAGPRVRFLSFDKRLSQAAVAAGLVVGSLESA
jgi:hypothetical protein